jgi:branched-chain amino acid transport system substrate-binding protein
LKGAQLRINEANAAGGIGGRQVQLISLDMKQSPTEAVKAFTKLAQEDGVCAVIGSAVFNAGLAVSPVADLAKVPLVSLSIDDRVTNPEMKADVPDTPGPVRQYAFLIQPSASQIAGFVAAYALEHFLLNRYATLYDPASAVSVLQARTFESVIRKGGKVISASVELPEGDYSGPLSKIRRVGADAIFVCCSVDKNVAVAQQAMAMAYQPVFLGNQAWYAPLLDQAGAASNSAWFGMGVAPDDLGLAEIGPKFQAQFGENPGLAVVPGWDAAGLIIAAVRKAGSSNPQKVRTALEQTLGFKCLTAQIDMGKKTHKPLMLPIAIMRIISGAYLTAEPRYIPKPAR